MTKKSDTKTLSIVHYFSYNYGLSTHLGSNKLHNKSLRFS